MAKSWCKVSAALDSHPRIRRAGNLGRQVFEFALRRNAELDKNGAIPAEHLEPEYLADVLMFSREDAVTGLSACVRTRLLASDGDQYVICGWDDDWGKHPMTEAERKRVSRAKARNNTDVTICPDTIVTESDGPECHRSEERRSDQIRGEERESAATAHPPAPGQPGDALTSGELATPKPPVRRKGRRPGLETELPADWAPRPAELELATTLGVDAAWEGAQFRDSAVAKRKTYADWDMAFRTWLRNAKRFSRGGNAAPGTAGRPPYARRSLFEVAMDEAAKAEARERAGGEP